MITREEMIPLLTEEELKWYDENSFGVYKKPIKEKCLSFSKFKKYDKILVKNLDVTKAMLPVKELEIFFDDSIPTEGIITDISGFKSTNIKDCFVHQYSIDITKRGSCSKTAWYQDSELELIKQYNGRTIE